MGFPFPLSRARSYINIIIYTFQRVQQTDTHTHTRTSYRSTNSVLHQQKQMREEPHKYISQNPFQSPFERIQYQCRHLVVVVVLI